MGTLSARRYRRSKEARSSDVSPAKREEESYKIVHIILICRTPIICHVVPVDVSSGHCRP